MNLSISLDLTYFSVFYRGFIFGSVPKSIGLGYLLQGLDEEGYFKTEGGSVTSLLN